MPREDLTGNKYIDDLNEAWPLGTDLPDAGDDHIRGIKNVLVKSFPNVSGPMTLNQDQINQGSVPVGSVLPFYNTNAPVGWSRVSPSGTNDYMARIIGSNASGGVTGGTQSPIANDAVPSHTHVVSGNTANSNAPHNHPGASGSAGSHAHGITGMTISGAGSLSCTGGCWGTPTQNNTASAGAHTHTITVGTASAPHVHSLSITSLSNAGATTRRPRYVNLLLCSRDAL